MRRLCTKQSLVIVFAALIAAQLYPIKPRNSPVTASKTIYTVQPMPESVRAVLQSSCKDCHSNETDWPWYSHIAPVSWIVIHDVREGRKHVNFSEWGTYSVRKQEDKLELICEQVTNGDMPVGMYAFFHRRVLLTQEQREQVCEWVDNARSTLPSS